jgi:hypothetical protein
VIELVLDVEESLHVVEQRRNRLECREAGLTENRVDRVHECAIGVFKANRRNSKPWLQVGHRRRERRQREAVSHGRLRIPRSAARQQRAGCVVAKQEIGRQAVERIAPGIDTTGNGLGMPETVPQQVAGVIDGDGKRTRRRGMRWQFDDIDSERREQLTAATGVRNESRDAMPAAAKRIAERRDRDEMTEAGADLPRKDDMRHRGAGDRTRS